MPTQTALPRQVIPRAPWLYAPTFNQKVWSWRTELFLAVIADSQGSWLWEVTTPEPQVLAAGLGESFSSSEHLVLEAIGKAYPLGFPYSCYVEEARHWYTLARGVRYSLMHLDAKHVVIKLDNNQQLAGFLTTGGWWLELSVGERRIQVNPERVLGVKIWNP